MLNTFKKQRQPDPVVTPTQTRWPEWLAVGGVELYLQPITVADIPEMAAVSKATYPTGVAWESMVFKEELLAQEDHLYLIARDRQTEALVAYVGMEVYRETATLHITNLTVAEAWRNQRVGLFLMTYTMLLARREQLASVSLEVAKENDAAQRFYERLGFHVVGEQPHYYGLNMHAYDMAQTLRK